MECLHTINKIRSDMKELYDGVKFLPAPECWLNSSAIEHLMFILKISSKIYTEPYCTVVAAITNFNIGMFQYDPYDIRLATEYLKKCIDLLEERKLTSEGILAAISANNQLGRIYMQRGLIEEAEDVLNQAEDLYVKFTEDIKLNPVYIVPILAIKEIEGDLCAKSILQKLHTLTLSYLMDFHRNPDNMCGFFPYFHKMLNSQLRQNKLTQDLNYVAWVANAVLIFEYLLKQNKFLQARHHLAAATYILEQYFEILKKKGTRDTSESIAAEYEHYDQKSVTIAGCWANYGIALLRESKERLLKTVDEEDQDSKPAKVSSEVCKYPQTETMDDLRFVDLEPELELITNKITDRYLLDSNDAGPVLLNVRKWVDKQKEYFTFERTGSCYGSIALKLSDAYKYLLFFEDDEDRQASIHKQRIDILEEINEKFESHARYFGRKIWIEMAETYSMILDLKMNRLQANVTSMAQMVAEIERLAKNSIKYYQSYFKYLNESKRIRGFSDNFLSWELDSYFRERKLYNNIIIFDILQGIADTQNSLDAYSFIVHYYDNHPEKQKELEKLGCCRIIKKIRHFVAAYARQI